MRTLLIFSLILLTTAGAQAAVVGTFVEAEPTNTARALPPTWYTTEDSRTDGLWEIDQSSGHESWDIFHDRDAVVAYQAQEPNAPMIATTIEGLTPGSSYDIRLVFGSHTFTNHSILAGLTSDSLTMFDQTNSDLAVEGTYFYEDGYMHIR